MESLYELTGQESGIVIYRESGEIIICNWSSIDGYPRLFGGWPIGLCEDIPDTAGHPITAKTLRALMRTHDNIIYDINNDYPGLLRTKSGGMIYNTPEVTVIAPTGWN